MNDDIKKWFKKTGYPLELYCYRELEGMKYQCIKSPLYEDSDTNKAVEIDLVAEKSFSYGSKYSIGLKFLVECKKFEQPLVILTDFNCSKCRYDWFYSSLTVDMPIGAFISMFESTNESIIKDYGEHLGRWMEFVPIGYSIVQAHKKTDQNIYKGIMKLSKAYAYWTKSYHEYFHHQANDSELHLIDKNYYQLISPILLVDSELYYGHLGEDDEPCLKEVDWALVKVRQQPDVFGEEWTMVHVVNKSKFSDMIQNFGRLHDVISKLDISEEHLKMAYTISSNNIKL